MMKRYIELVMRPSSEVITLKPLRGKSSLPAPRGLAWCRTSLCDRPAAVARCLTPPMERAHHEARQKGNLNPGGGEGTWGTAVGREQVWGPGLGSLLTMLPGFRGTPT